MSKRANNFSRCEVDKLLELIEQRKKIIENKKADRTSVDDRIKAWKEIEEHFNAKYGDIYRSYKELKTKYQNIKKLKKNIAKDRQEPSNTSDIDWNNFDIFQAKQLFGVDASLKDEDPLSEDNFVDDIAIDKKEDDGVLSVIWAEVAKKKLQQYEQQIWHEAEQHALVKKKLNLEIEEKKLKIKLLEVELKNVSWSLSEQI